MLPEPGLRHAADFDIDLDPVREMGDGRGGKRRIIPIVGGRVTGPRVGHAARVHFFGEHRADRIAPR